MYFLPEGNSWLYIYDLSHFLYQNRLFSEGVTVEDESDNDEADSLLANKNPFRTSETHPFLETAFNLGMIGLERLREKPDDLDHSWIPHYRVIRNCPVKEHLNEFCRQVLVYSALCFLYCHVTLAPARYVLPYCVRCCMKLSRCLFGDARFLPELMRVEHRTIIVSRF